MATIIQGPWRGFPGHVSQGFSLPCPCSLFLVLLQPPWSPCFAGCLPSLTNEGRAAQVWPRPLGISRRPKATNVIGLLKAATHTWAACLTSPPTPRMSYRCPKLSEARTGLSICLPFSQAFSSSVKATAFHPPCSSGPEVTLDSSLTALSSLLANPHPAPPGPPGSTLPKPPASLASSLAHRFLWQSTVLTAVTIKHHLFTEDSHITPSGMGALPNPPASTWLLFPLVRCSANTSSHLSTRP